MRIETPDYQDYNDYLEKMFGISDSEERTNNLSRLILVKWEQML